MTALMYALFALVWLLGAWVVVRWMAVNTRVPIVSDEQRVRMVARRQRKRDIELAVIQGGRG